MQILEHLPTLTLNPANSERLKQLVLELAVRGKLTENWRRNHPGTEPASTLLQRIQEEKARLIKEKKIKKEKLVSNLSEDDLLHQIPINWEWATFGEVTINRDGERIPVSRADREKRKGEYDYYGASGVIDKIDDYLFDKDLLLIGEDGANLINRSTPIAFIATGKYWVNNHAHVVDAIDYSTLEYLRIFINSINLEAYVTGMAQPKMNQKKMNSIPVAVPPLAEQQAIVSIVDQLMERIDTLTEEAKERISTKRKLAQAALHHLTLPEEDFTQRWQFVKQHFRLLFDDATNVKKLRESILQLAVQGKLTEHWRRENPDTEPACELLERIQEEKARLVKAKKIKKEKPLPPIEADEIPYELPEGWVWCRLGELTEKMGAGSTPTGGRTAYVEEGYKFLRSQNVYDDGLRLDSVAKIPSKIHQKMSGTHVFPKDLLLNITGASIGRCALVPDDFDSGNVSQHVSILRLIDLNLTEIIHKIIISKYFQDTIMDVQVGVSREGLSMTRLKLFPIPLPPLAEQQAIVRIVDQLMGLCEQLQAQASQATQQEEALMQALMHGVFVEGEESVEAVSIN